MYFFPLVTSSIYLPYENFLSVSQIQTSLIRIWILLFTLIQIQILLFDTNLDPYHFKEVVYLKQYFLYIST
jgi:hypothetical protein